MSRPNVLLITLDQFRGDCLSAAGHPVVRTPQLDRLAAGGVLFRRHYSQAAPCGPGRAALYTGMYQMNNRVVGNGTPLDDRFDNVARIARRSGYRPALFGYTDQGVDPRLVDDPSDPRLSTYTGILPGFDVELDLPGPYTAWFEWLAERGYDLPRDDAAALRSEPERPAELSTSAFLTDRLLGWIGRQDEPWFAHASYLRPHPPYAAAGRWAGAYDPDEVGDPIEPLPEPLRHPFHTTLMGVRELTRPANAQRMRAVRAQYYGMISEVDDQLGRVWDALQLSGAWKDTIVVVTADHGEQLGDHGLVQKAGFFESSYHVLGLVRDPRLPAGHGSTVHSFTENVDIVPTICEAIGAPVPLQCDGLPLTSFLRDEVPPYWRDAATWEFDWRTSSISASAPPPWPWDQRLERQHLTVRRSSSLAYVQFGDGSWRCFDVAADPTWRTEVHDPGVVLAEAQAMLVWRSRHTDRGLADMLLEHGGIGRWSRDASAARGQ
jgi:arylsulfatase A-like enzyme